MRSLVNNEILFMGLSILFLIGGLICLAIGIVYDVRYATYPTATAVVVNVDYQYDDEGDLMACPTYRYVVDGHAYETKSKGYESAWSCPKEGSTKTIRYNPNRPGEILDSVILCIILTVLGVAATAGGVGALIAKLRIDKKRVTNNIPADDGV